ncbi:coat protein gamma subunit [Plasmodium ovale curtisi]|nr:coat protein gamma subunit [Plasmodium ovale curtisi]
MMMKEKLQRNLIKETKYEDDKAFVNPHEGDKASILQETRAFSNYPLNIQKCLNILTKILYLINKGEDLLTTQECTDLFFSITKLFQSNNERLRRMVYLVIKNLPVNDKEIFIVTSSLTKDMNSANDCYRANAIKVLSKIIDSSMAIQIERYLKTSIVDRNSFVSCSAILCGLNLYLNSSCDIVKRWINEISECINSKNHMIQFHALTLLCSIKCQDKLALEKIISSYSKNLNNLTGSLANCLLIRYASYLIYTVEIENEMKNDASKFNMYSNVTERKYNSIHEFNNEKKKKIINPTTKVCFDYLKNCMKSKDVMILFECIKNIFDLAILDKNGNNCTTVFNIDILNDCIKICQLFLLSEKTIDKFSIIRQINKLSHYRPLIISKLNEDIENLLMDNNKSICVLAFTTLLKTGSETNIDKLLNQINNYMSGDNCLFKIKIIEEVKDLCFIYPTKCNIILTFLAKNLRDEESYQFKSNTIDAMILIISQLPNAEETAILQLCEFIEDCEHNSLLLRVIRFLLLHIPKTKDPSKYIRYIYNRLILENSTIRVDGMYALFHIALKCAENSKDILFLLKCLLTDNDDEVRDRTNLFYRMLSEKVRRMETSIKGGTDGGIDRGTDGGAHGGAHGNVDDVVGGDLDDVINGDSLLDALLANERPANIEQLLYQITNHLQNAMDEEFVYESGKDDVGRGGDGYYRDGASSHSRRKSSCSEMLINTSSMNKHVDQMMDSVYLENVAPLVEKYNLGALKIITKSMPLTESEAEYTVFVKKYIYDNHVVMEFIIHNTLTEHILSNVVLQINSYEKKWTVVEKTTIQNVYYNAPQQLYVLLSKNYPFTDAEAEEKDRGTQNGYDVNQHFHVALHFVTKENEMDDGFPDSYSINPITLQITDFIHPKILRNGEFKHLWESMDSTHSESISKFSLNFENIHLAVVGLLNTLNMMACDQTDVVQNGATNHNILLSAKFLNESLVLCKASLILSQQYGCLLKIVCRAGDKLLSDSLLKVLE